jgi:sulfur-oxidizing protein SoxZ
MSSIKMRANVAGDVTTVKALISHPMETGMRKDAAGKLIPADFIQEVSCEYNGAAVLTAQWGAAISKNPYLSFRFKGGKEGDTLKMSWKDNTGKTDSAEAQINAAE